MLHARVSENILVERVKGGAEGALFCRVQVWIEPDGTVACGLQVD